MWVAFLSVRAHCVYVLAANAPEFGIHWQPRLPKVFYGRPDIDRSPAKVCIVPLSS